MQVEMFHQKSEAIGVDLYILLGLLVYIMKCSKSIHTDIRNRQPRIPCFLMHEGSSDF